MVFGKWTVKLIPEILTIFTLEYQEGRKVGVEELYQNLQLTSCAKNQDTGVQFNCLLSFVRWGDKIAGFYK